MDKLELHLRRRLAKVCSRWGRAKVERHQLPTFPIVLSINVSTPPGVGYSRIIDTQSWFFVFSAAPTPT